MRKPKPPIVPIVMAIVIFGLIVTINQMNSPRVAQPEAPPPTATTQPTGAELKGEMAGSMKMTQQNAKPTVATAPEKRDEGGRERRSATATQPKSDGKPPQEIPATATSSQWFDEESAIR